MTAEQLAKQFHETYERLAPQFGYKTREESAKPWADVPWQNRKLMTAVCAEVLTHAAAQLAERDKEVVTDWEATVKVKALAAVILWFSFGYIGAAQWAGSFAGDYGPNAANVESLGECSRTSLAYFIAGPIGAVDGFIMSSHKPMWDWPKHLLEYGPQP